MENIGSIVLKPGKTYETYLIELEENRCRFGNGLAETLMENSGFTTKEVAIDLIGCPLSELGFTKPANTTAISKVVESRGFKKCPEGVIFETVFTLLPKITTLFPEKDGVHIWTDTGLWMIGKEKESGKYSSFIAKSSAHAAIGYYPDLIIVFAK